MMKLASSEMASSSSSSLVKKKKKKQKKKDLMIYFPVMYTTYDPENPEKKEDILECYDWYAFDPYHSPSQQYKKIYPITKMITPLLHGSPTPLKISSISLNSKLYVFKTYVVKKSSSPSYPITYISMYDTVGGDWVDILLSKKLKMISPKLIACGGKIFILGKNLAHRDLSTIWGEVFDPTTNSFTPLPKPPALYTDESLTLDSTAVIDDNRFLVKFKYQLQMVIFDVNLWSWSSINIPYVSCGDHLKMIVSCGVVYFFCGLEMFMYHLSQGANKLIQVQGLKLPSNVAPVFRPFFPFHIGGNNFYLIWTPNEFSRARGSSVIHCLKFRVDPMIDYQGEHIWAATVDGCDSYLVDGSGICDCVAMEISTEFDSSAQPNSAMEISTEHKNKKRKKNTTTVDKKLSKKRKKDTTTVEKKLSTETVTLKEKEQLIYFCVVYTEYDRNNLEKKDFLECYDWYSFNPYISLSPFQQYQKISPNTRMLTPVIHGSRIPRAVSSVFLNSKLYVFKSYINKNKITSPPSSYPCTYISIYDTITKNWINNLDIQILKIFSPKLLPCGGKIFILRCNFSLKFFCHWGYVFDPITNTLTPLPTPPALCNSEESLIAHSSTVIDEGRFLVYFKPNCSSYIFDIYSCIWTPIRIPLISCDPDFKMVVVSGILYVYDGMSIFSYDLFHGGNSLIKVQGLELPPPGVGPIRCPYFFFHRGEKNFCLIWTPWSHHKAAYGSHVIHCMNFRLNPVMDYRGKHVLEATNHGCDSYLVDGGSIRDCVAVEMESNRTGFLERCGSLKIAA
ncbi:hypothetical protein AQUCO_02500327v1 [Aquilegia coerulea]|uniref:Uncharacterized protein n=1 Tax=Aquilegia coerulea TaxID=218851 RepID=A0A2G5DAJ6_AQUCA|nr:hypothetical protein AQUCO_02500327v1 [Aquilegia coerulea]